MHFGVMDHLPYGHSFIPTFGSHEDIFHLRLINSLDLVFSTWLWYHVEVEDGSLTTPKNHCMQTPVTEREKQSYRGLNPQIQNRGDFFDV